MRIPTKRDELPVQTWQDSAEDLLEHFPGVDRAELLRDLMARAFLDLRYGNKREERAACDLLNTVQELAIRNLKAATPNP